MYFFFLFSNNKMWPLSKSLFNRIDRVFAKNILDFHNKVVKNKNHKYLSPCCYIKYFVTFKSLMGKYCKKIRKWKCKILKDNMPNLNYFCNLLFWGQILFFVHFQKMFHSGIQNNEIWKKTFCTILLYTQCHWKWKNNTTYFFFLCFH